MRVRSRRSNAFRLGVLFLILAAANGYIFFFRGGTSLRDLRRVSAEKRALPALLPPPKAAPRPFDLKKLAATAIDEPLSEQEGRVVGGVVGPSDTLAAVLKREEIPARTVGNVAAALTKVFDPRLVQGGHRYTLRFDGEDRLRTLEYETNAATRYRVERSDEHWQAVREHVPLETRVVEIGATIGSSLHEAVKRTGEGSAVVAYFVDLFAWDVNFFVDTKAGDRFKMVVEKLFVGGKFYKYGRVLGAEYVGHTGTFRAFWFEPEPGRGGYYNERGESIVKSLLKTPLKYVRISSSFDRRRFHPILHSERAHLGVDYAAPTGTPVWATAGGRVTWRGPRGGAGKCVSIAHPGGMESIYLHLSRFARGLEVGDTVRQKQVIGYVGATGLATGPHLHFSVKMGGHFVDPRRLKPARAAPLGARYREAFAEAVELGLERLGKVVVAPAAAGVAQRADATGTFGVASP